MREFTGLLGGPFIREEYLGLKYRKMPSLLMKSILSLGVRAWDDQSARDVATRVCGGVIPTS